MSEDYFENSCQSSCQSNLFPRTKPKFFLGQSEMLVYLYEFAFVNWVSNLMREEMAKCSLAKNNGSKFVTADSCSPFSSLIGSLARSLKGFLAVKLRGFSSAQPKIMVAGGCSQQTTGAFVFVRPNFEPSRKCDEGIELSRRRRLLFIFCFNFSSRF